MGNLEKIIKSAEALQEKGLKESLKKLLEQLQEECIKKIKSDFSVEVKFESVKFSVKFKDYQREGVLGNSLLFCFEPQGKVYFAKINSLTGEIREVKIDEISTDNIIKIVKELPAVLRKIAEAIRENEQKEEAQRIIRTIVKMGQVKKDAGNN